MVLSERFIVASGDMSMMLKHKMAFGVFRDVICEVYPFHRGDLGTYLAVMSDLTMAYRGTLFMNI